MNLNWKFLLFLELLSYIILDILFGSRYASLRLLLEDMEDIHSKFKPDSIDSAISIPIKIMELPNSAHAQYETGHDLIAVDRSWRF
jgi:hypothetical protein